MTTKSLSVLIRTHYPRLRLIVHVSRPTGVVIGDTHTDHYKSSTNEYLSRVTPTGEDPQTSHTQVSNLTRSPVVRSEERVQHNTQVGEVK